MAMPLRKVHGSPVRLGTVCLALATVVLPGAGCAQRTFRAASLPAEFLAPATPNIAEIDLSRLNSYAVNSQLIDRGDVLEVSIVTDLSAQQVPTMPVRVGEDGHASIPVIGPVPLAGLELEGAEQAIAATGVARRVFARAPHVTVTMKRQRTNRVYVIGAVEKEGVYELPRNASSLLAALVAAGGLSKDAGTDVEIRRTASLGAPRAPMPPPQRIANAPEAQLTAFHTPAADAQIIRVNLAASAAEGNGGHLLGDGDTIIVAKRAPKPIYVGGLVRKPDEYELPPSQDMYLLDAISKAGDRTLQVADRVIIRRQIPGQREPVVIVASMREAKLNAAANVRLAPGDYISVEETPLTFLMKTATDITRFSFGGAVGLF